MARYKYSTDDYTIYVEKIDENSVIYHFEGEKSHTAKINTTLKGRAFFSSDGRYVLLR